MTDSEILDKALEVDNFWKSFDEDSLADWAHAKELGKYLIRVSPELLIGHLVLARACRHLGESLEARAALNECRVIAGCGNLGGEDFMLPRLEKEERHWL